MAGASIQTVRASMQVVNLQYAASAKPNDNVNIQFDVLNSGTADDTVRLYLVVSDTTSWSTYVGNLPAYDADVGRNAYYYGIVILHPQESEHEQLSVHIKADCPAGTGSFSFEVTLLSGLSGSNVEWTSGFEMVTVSNYPTGTPAGIPGFPWEARVIGLVLASGLVLVRRRRSS
jgi:hypothetical protein